MCVAHCRGDRSISGNSESALYDNRPLRQRIKALPCRHGRPNSLTVIAFPACTVGQRSTYWPVNHPAAPAICSTRNSPFAPHPRAPSGTSGRNFS